MQRLESGITFQINSYSFLLYLLIYLPLKELYGSPKAIIYPFLKAHHFILCLVDTSYIRCEQ